MSSLPASIATTGSATESCWVPINEKTLFDLRCEADFVKTVHAHKENILSLQGSSKLAERSVDVSEAVEEIKALLAKGIEGHVKMETAPLMFTDYVEKEEIPIMASTYSMIQKYREGSFAQEIKGLKRPSRGSARWDEDTRVYDTIIYCHDEYSKHLGDFVDTVTPDEFRLWLTEPEGSEVEKAKIQELVKFENELGSAIDLYKGNQNKINNFPACGTCASEQDSMMDRVSSAICV